jgi:hypothetical protein
MNLPLALYIFLFAIAIFAPLRWSIVAYLVLSAVDFDSGNSGIGILNAAKGLVYPLYLLWRLRSQAGHKTMVLAPIAWLSFVAYVAIACIWSQFPLSAIKLVGEMIGSFLICLAFLRAAKGGYLTPSILLPVTIGVLALGVLRGVFLPGYGDERDRFNGFTTAQGYASLLVSLYALALCSKSLKPVVRVPVCAVLFIAVVFNGSRIWLLGLLGATLIGLFISEAKSWLKICTVGLGILVAAGVVWASDPIMTLIAKSARSNRIAAMLTAVYEGDEKSAGLGTYRFRRGLYQHAIEAIESSSVTQLMVGHGTSNGRFLRGDLNKGIGDPNRAVHDEWLRIFYEWGIVGSLLWLVFVGSIIVYAYQGVRRDKRGYARPLLAYLPAFLAGLSTENMLAGAGYAANIGLLFLIALASVSHRQMAKQAPGWRRLEPREREQMDLIGRRGP